MKRYRTYFQTTLTDSGDALVQGTLVSIDGKHNIGISQITKSDLVSLSKTKQAVHDTLIRAYRICSSEEEE